MKRSSTVVLLLVVVVVLVAVIMVIPRGGTVRVVVRNSAWVSETMIVTVDGNEIYNQVTPGIADVALTYRAVWFGMFSGCPTHTAHAIRPNGVWAPVSDTEYVVLCDGQTITVTLSV